MELPNTDHAHPRQAVAHRLGVHRHTIGPWLARYEAGGLDALLARYVPAGTPLARPPEGLAALEQVLRPPAGCASSVARCQWSKQTHHLDVNEHTLYPIVRPRCNAKLKVPRPSPTQHP